MKQVIKVLHCDDDSRFRNNFGDVFPKAWNDSIPGAPRIEYRWCYDIVTIDDGRQDSVSLSKVGIYDIVLLDLRWQAADGGDARPQYGIDLCKMIKAEFPEVPIVVYSDHAKAWHFSELVRLEIAGYVSKKDEGGIVGLCHELYGVWERATTNKSGLRIFRCLRQFLSDGIPAWHAKEVNSAASEVWRKESERAKWESFWKHFDGILSGVHMFNPVKTMRRFFADTDLLNFGVNKTLRGHLGHVVQVYLSGYIISHRLPCVREAVLVATKNLLGKDYVDTDADKYWSFFQVAWLMAGTLHDTGYAMEMIPEAVEQLRDIQGAFSFISVSDKLPEHFKCKIDRSQVPKAETIFQTFFGKLESGFEASWVWSRSTFGEGNIMVSHGIASAFKFLLLLEEQMGLGRNPNADPVLNRFLEWSAVAMALHSLKKPGKDDGKQICFSKDPLSALLLLCDELQVWNRERPDSHAEAKSFRRIDVEAFDVDGGANSIVVKVRCELFENADTTTDDAISKLRSKIEEETLEINAYLDISPLYARVEYRIAGAEDTVLVLAIGKPPTM